MTPTARILMIDASRESLGYHQRWLQAEGYGVEMTTFLETTQEEVERWHSNVIVFDLLADAVQEQQTWQLIRQFKASLVLPPFPLLICASSLRSGAQAISQSSIKERAIFCVRSFCRFLSPSLSYTFFLSSNAISSQNIIEFFSCDKFDGFDDRLVFSGREELLVVILLDEFTTVVLDSSPDFFEITSSDFHGHEAVNHCESVVKIGAEDSGHEEPRLQ